MINSLDSTSTPLILFSVNTFYVKWKSVNCKRLMFLLQFLHLRDLHWIPLVPHWCNSSTLHSFVLFFVLLLTIPASIWCTGGSFNCSSEWGTRTEASVLTLNLRCSRKAALSMPWTVFEILSLPFILVFSQTISFYVSFASFARVPLAPIPPRSNPFEWLKRMMASHDLNAFEGACYLRFYYILGQMLLHIGLCHI